MRRILAYTPRWSSPGERRARAAVAESEPMVVEAYTRPRPAPGELYAQLATLYRGDEMAELMRALDG